VTGDGIVADIDTEWIPTHPVLQPVWCLATASTSRGTSRWFRTERSFLVPVCFYSPCAPPPCSSTYMPRTGGR